LIGSSTIPEAPLPISPTSTSRNRAKTNRARLIDKRRNKNRGQAILRGIQLPETPLIPHSDSAPQNNSSNSFDSAYRDFLRDTTSSTPRLTGSQGQTRSSQSNISSNNSRSKQTRR